MNSQTSGKRPLLWLVLAFVLPVALAKLVLNQHWYSAGATNQGLLMPGESSYHSLGVANPLPRRWQIVYLLPQHCDPSCENRLHMMRQLHQALGGERDRVSPLLLIGQSSDRRPLAGLDFATAEAPASLEPLLNEQQLMLVDPMGTLVMRYPMVSGLEANIAQGKAMLADLRKLLKLSRVG